MSMLLILMLQLSWASAPGEDVAEYSKEDLDRIVQVADAEFFRFDGRCSATSPSAEESELAPVGRGKVDVEAERAFMRMAEMRRLIVQYYPYDRLDKKKAPEVRSDDVSQAAQLLEMAYDCNPGWDQRRYLGDAIDMIVARRKQIREQERRPDSVEDSVALLTVEKRLRDKLGRLQAPVCSPMMPVCPTAPRPVISSESPRGYRKRLMGLFSLGVEFGGSFYGRLYEGIQDDGVPDDHSRPTAFVLGLAPGIRLQAGARQRHVFGLGFRYTLLAFREEGAKDHVSQMAARFEYGYRFHERWFSLHGSFEPGIQVHPVQTYFGHAIVGGGGRMCTWNEALCLRVGGSRSVLPGSGPYFDAAYVTFGVDVMRVVDNIMRATEGES